MQASTRPAHRNDLHTEPQLASKLPPQKYRKNAGEKDKSSPQRGKRASTAACIPLGSASKAATERTTPASTSLRSSVTVVARPQMRRAASDRSSIEPVERAAGCNRRAPRACKDMKKGEEGESIWDENGTTH